MKLTWTTTDKGYTADGENYTYTIEGKERYWYVNQLRQAAGQIVRRVSMFDLQAAFMRAQTWENH